jgi:hypothetical protein
MSVSAQTSTVTDEVNASTQPAPATNVLNNGNNDRAFRRRGNPRPRTYNEAGIQTVKGGSEIGAGFFDSVTTSYTNLVNNPIALIFIIVATLGLLSMNHGTLTPLDTMYNAALNKSNSDTTPNAIRSISAGYAWLLSIIISFQDFLLPAIFFGGIYIAKPSANNAWLCSAITLICWISRMNYLEVCALGHLTILFTQMRDPIYKLGVLLFAVVTIIIGFTHMSGYVGLSGLKAVSAASSGQDPPVDPPVTPPVDPPVEEVFV